MAKNEIVRITYVPSTVVCICFLILQFGQGLLGQNKAKIWGQNCFKRPLTSNIHTPFKQQLFDLGGHLEFILSKKFIFLGVSLILAISPRPWPGTKS